MLQQQPCGDRKSSSMISYFEKDDDVGDEVDDVGDDDDGQVVSRVLALQFPVKLLNLLKRCCLSPPREGIIIIITMMTHLVQRKMPRL